MTIKRGTITEGSHLENKCGYIGERPQFGNLNLKIFHQIDIVFILD